ncbi:hypothetical protein L202_04813 [Cryptococcus amylolentus CBS 6039]|uniref:UDENN domain-containing protein n=1 Tax=Cryptococcus amylolentus CBS 6039 TaxID=1295533 RepID=A0A1E3HMT5_9TREE|nr:hypothetical protein L202_04813 [Cryptococcus amylolentus CBS 6039]ODN77662.1 hypothetical protein L202_04813 [Cryptococcus amylolentus CBS 6039]
MLGHEDADEGDISLAFTSNTASRAAAAPARPLAPASDFEQDVAVPSPRRLFNNALLNTESASNPGQRIRSSQGVAVSLNDQDGATSTATAPGHWAPGALKSGSRPSSAQPLSPQPYPNVDTSRIPFSTQSPGLPRRTSSGIKRSRSLNVRLPSADDSSSSDPAQNSKQAPMSATSSRPTPSSRIGWSRRPGDPRPPPMISPEVAEKMGRWVKDVVVCNFDLDRGPVVERKAGSRRWGFGEKENVAFSSFPDTSLFAEGTVLFSFKIRHIPPDLESLSLPEPPSPMPDRTNTVEEELLNDKLNTEGAASASHPATMSTGEKADEYRKWDERGREWLYGFVWFEQRQDQGIRRGYMQKSLVILTHLPFPALFASVLQRVAPAFFEYGYSALEAACHSIAKWPDPTPDTLLSLPFMSDVLNVKLPDTSESTQMFKVTSIPSAPSPSHAPILASLPTSTPLRTFAPFIASLWSLWECLVLSEPILVIAPDPKTCSEIVWWLRDLMRPLPPAGDFRPYLHIHDHDFSLLVNANKPQPGVVVGVTNPFFRNAASHWPNVISIPSKSRKTRPSSSSSYSNPLDGPEGFITRRHRSVQKDRPLLKRLEALVADGNLDDPAGNEALRSHFQQLTERFMVPLNRYFQTLVPTQTPIPGMGSHLTPSMAGSPHPSANNLPSPSPSPSLSASPMPSPAVFSHLSPSLPVPLSSQSPLTAIRPFSLPAFLIHLRNSGPNPLLFRSNPSKSIILTGKSRVENDFYASFCMSAGFAGWLGGRVESLGGALAGSVSRTGTPRLSTSSSRSVSSSGLTVPSTPSRRSPAPGEPSHLRSVSSTPITTTSAELDSESAQVTPKAGLGARPAFSRSASVGLGISGGGPGLSNVDKEEGRKESSEDDP